MALLERSESYGELQKVVDYLFRDARVVRRLDVIIAAEIHDIHPDLMSICELLPPGSFTRDTLCVQLNSSIAGHAWGYVYGTVE
ncbi:hypothetical protein [Slackia exigua]|uniref:hypothetical protein n=1 Tax=Slackia exigua TaxID=84109 RepID=UPI0020039403|nr:hypothetical protein [Slackia exigua]MCK6138855.1 hypothetical protein [Slackia exigua]